MNYEETLEYLYSQLPMYQRIGKAAYKSDLGTTIALDELFSHPHRLFRSIHIAGTNGKGSVSHMIAAVLQEAGYKTGLYTSPHLRDFRERIRINGRMVSREYVVEFVNSNRAVIEKLNPSFFEMTVAMAFEYFAHEKVDIAVVEAGMGGRLDSTNIITPLVSVITNIGLDHTEFLGDTLPLIAGEKAGIIKKRVPVVIGEAQEATRAVFMEAAERNEAVISFASEIFGCSHAQETDQGMQSFDITKDGKPAYEQLETDLLGYYQQKNILTVLQTIDILKHSGTDINTRHIYEGLRSVSKRTGLLGRWQITGRNPLIVCDTAHNADGLMQVLNQLGSTPYRDLHMVIGFVNDKNIRQILRLFPREATYYFTRADIPRALDAGELHKEALSAGLSGQPYNTVKEALEAAAGNASRADLIFVGGSTFVVAEALDDTGDFT
jgi:dihydrofolate synthase / folylpolyglutamate synthase